MHIASFQQFFHAFLGTYTERNFETVYYNTLFQIFFNYAAYAFKKIPLLIYKNKTPR